MAQVLATVTSENNRIYSALLDGIYQGIAIISPVCKRYSASIPSINLLASEQAATGHDVISILIAIQCATLPRCILELSHLLCVSYPDCRGVLLPSVRGFLHDLCQS